MNIALMQCLESDLYEFHNARNGGLYWRPSALIPFHKISVTPTEETVCKPPFVAVATVVAIAQRLCMRATLSALLQITRWISDKLPPSKFARRARTGVRTVTTIATLMNRFPANKSTAIATFATAKIYK